MFDTPTKIFFAVLITLLIWVIIVLIKKVKRHKEVAKNIPPTRFLNETDLKAIQYIDLDANLSVNLLLRRKLPRTKLQKSVWEFTNLELSISSIYRYKRIVHNFYLLIDGKTIEVAVPDVFLPYLEVGKLYSNQTIEVIFNLDFFILYSVQGIISYPELHQKLLLKGGYNEEFSSMRPATEEERTAFSISKWTNTWALILPFLLPTCVLGIMDEGPGISIVFLPFLLIVFFPLIKAYKKRKKYIDSRMVYTLRGKIWFDEEKYIHKIDDKPLKLHRKWEKLFKKTKLPIEDAEIEALLHTFDTLDLKAKLKLQPISIKSNTLKINERTHKSTRSWGIPFLYLISSGSISYLAPQMTYVFSDITSIDLNSEGIVFKAIMTLIWLCSLVTTAYLAFTVLKRIRGHYFAYERV